MPSSDVWHLYRDLGGRLVTLGSDSHKPEHLGAHLKEGQRALRDLGFTEFVTYRRHVPEAHPLARPQGHRSRSLVSAFAVVAQDVVGHVDG